MMVIDKTIIFNINGESTDDDLQYLTREKSEIEYIQQILISLCLRFHLDFARQFECLRHSQKNSETICLKDLSKQCFSTLNLLMKSMIS